jgi:hypothetical protein
MEDTLKDFIGKNRGALDVREPSSRVWQGIHITLFGKQHFLTPLVLWRAAAVVFMVLSAYLYFSRTDVTQRSQQALSEFNDIEVFYMDQITQKVELIRAEPASEAGLNGFTRDFQQLEAMYQVLKEEMKSRPSEKVRDALVLNLLVRIDLLNKQLHYLELGDVKEEKAENSV